MVCRSGAEEHKEQHTLDALVDKLYEKRAATREAALDRLLQWLTTRPQEATEVAQRQETLARLLLQSLRKGATLEASRACHAISLLSLILGECQSTTVLLAEAGPLLERAALHGEEESRAAAIDALALATFVGSDSPLRLQAAARFFVGLAQQSPVRPAALAASLRALALVASAAPSWMLEGPLAEESLPILHSRLHHEDLAVRQAAGEAAALLSASLPEEAEPGSGAEWEESAGPSSDTPAQSTASVASVALEAITDRMRDLSTSRGDGSVKRRSQKDRRATRAAFRALTAAVDEARPGPCPMPAGGAVWRPTFTPTGHLPDNHHAPAARGDPHGGHVAPGHPAWGLPPLPGQWAPWAPARQPLPPIGPGDRTAQPRGGPGGHVWTGAPRLLLNQEQGQGPKG